MFEKILIATDLSPASDSIVNCGGAFRKLGAEKALLCHALGLRHLEELKHQITPLVEPRLKKQKDLLENAGLKTEIIIAPGIPSIEINRISEEKDVSLIIIGTHGESLASHLLFKFGGVASEILHSHEKPLLLVRTEVKEEDGEACVKVSCTDFRKNILYATDFSDTAHRAFLYVEEIVKKGCQGVTLLHVQEKARIEKYLGDKLEEFNRIDTERLEMLRKKLLEKGAKDVRPKIPYGNPTSEILKELKVGYYSLVVMGSQGRGFIQEVFLGSVSHNIARMGKEICAAKWRPAFLSCAHACNLITTMHEANGVTLAIDVMAALRRKVGFARGLLASGKPEKARSLVKEIMAARDAVLVAPPPVTSTREAYLEALPELSRLIDGLAVPVGDGSGLKTALGERPCSL